MPVVFLQRTELGFEPWISDGSAGSTRLLLDTTEGRSDLAGGFFNIGVDAGDTLFFHTSGEERIIWRTDGTVTGTSPVLSDTQGNASLYRYGAVDVNGYSITSGSTDGIHGVYSVSANGDAVMLLPTVVEELDAFRTRIASPEAIDFVQIGELAVFRTVSTELGVDESSLYASDGTLEGTIELGVFDGHFHNLSFDRDAVVNGRLIFVAPETGNIGLNIVYSTDGTVDGTFRLPSEGDFGGLLKIVQAGDLVYYTVREATSGGQPPSQKVWQSDGTFDGTFVVADMSEMYPWPSPITIGTTRGEFFTDVVTDGSDVAFLARLAKRESVDRTLYELFTIETGAVVSHGIVGESFPIDPAAERGVTELIGINDGYAFTSFTTIINSSLFVVDLETDQQSEIFSWQYSAELSWLFHGETFSVIALANFVSSGLGYSVTFVATDGSRAGTEVIGTTRISRTGDLSEHVALMDGDAFYFVGQTDFGTGVLVSDGMAAGTERISADPNTTVLGPLSLIGTVADIPTQIATAGDDLLEGNNAANTLAGLAGDDVVNGLSGDDDLSGNSGNDTLNGGAGNDVINGGGGVDTASYSAASGGVVIQLATGSSRGGDGRDTLISIENVQGSGFGDFIAGTTAANTLSGGGGNDRLKGNGGNDTLLGQAGDDFLKGSSGSDLLDGGLGSDIVLGFSGNDDLLGGKGNDFLYGGQDSDMLMGGAGDDLLRGNRGGDTIFGDAGADQLRGGGNGDVLDGGEGDDFVLGEGGADILTGGAGNDTLVGGFGAGVNDGLRDIFVFGSRDGASGGFDRIKDFENGIDVLDLTGFGFVDFSTQVLTLASDRPGGLRVDFGDGDILFVEGFAKSEFDPSDVMLS